MLSRGQQKCAATQYNGGDWKSRRQKCRSYGNTCILQVKPLKFGAIGSNFIVLGGLPATGTDYVSQPHDAGAWQAGRIGVISASSGFARAEDQTDDTEVRHEWHVVDHLTGGPTMSHIDFPVWPPRFGGGFFVSRSENSTSPAWAVSGTLNGEENDRDAGAEDTAP